MSWKETCYVGDWSFLWECWFRGPDAEKLFSDYSTLTFKNFAIGQSKHCIHCNETGKVIHEGILAKFGENEYLLFGRGCFWMKYNLERGNYDVTTEDVDYFNLQVSGPNAIALLEEVTKKNLRDTKYMHQIDIEINGKKFFALRQGMAGEPGYELVGPHEWKEEIIDVLMSAGEKYGIRRLGGRTVFINHLEACYPTIITDYIPAMFSNDLKDYLETFKTKMGPSFTTLNLYGSYEGKDISEYYRSPLELGWSYAVKFDHYEVYDLRSALELLNSLPEEIIETNVEVDLEAELSGVYRYIGAGGTVRRPTKEGPAMLFHNIKGHPNAKVVIGVLASRKRVAAMLHTKSEDLGKLLYQSVENPIPPVVIHKPALCQEIVHKAEEADFDLFKLIPAPTNTPDDAGPYITMGMCYATHPETGESDVTIHRLCIQSRDELSIYMVPGARHIGAMFERAEELDRRLPISISIGVDPAIEIGACFEPPTTPFGYNELAVAGSLRKHPVELCKCITINEHAIANAEYVIEGEMLPNIRVREDQNRNTGYAMPEFPGYTGPAFQNCCVIKVKAVTHRKNPIMQTCIGPSEEHVSMAGIPTEASIYGMIERAMPGRLKNVYAASAGGGKYMAILQFKKLSANDEGKQRQAALLAFSAFSELKHIFIVDEDVDCFDMNDVLWAMNTRFQGNTDIIIIPGVKCHPLDPSNSPSYSPAIRDIGIACKTIFDCTVPFDQKEHFQRAKFMEVNPEHWL